MGVTGKVKVVMSEDPGGEESEGESLKGLRRSIRAVLVPETGMPRIRRCCLSSETLQCKGTKYVLIIYICLPVKTIQV